MSHSKNLIDADILVYRVGFGYQEESLESAKEAMDGYVEEIQEATGANEYSMYLTASNDDTAFRSKVYPEYKQNRKAPRPLHYKALREYLVEKYGAIVVSTIEADDAMGQAQTENTIICTIDKDLDMIPGWHYNFVKKTGYFIDEDEAIYNFYRQLLMGDSADNVKGIQGIGEKKANKILAGATDEEELFQRVRDSYNNDYEMAITGEVLWILRKPFPQGMWRYTLYGSKLGQLGDYQLSLDLSPGICGSEFTGEVESTAGFLLNGISLPDNSIPKNAESLT